MAPRSMSKLVGTTINWDKPTNEGGNVELAAELVIRTLTSIKLILLSSVDTHLGITRWPICDIFLSPLRLVRH